MKLRYDPPQALEERLREAKYILPFDVDMAGAPCEGLFAMGTDGMRRYIGGQLSAEFPLEGLKKIKAVMHIGCGALEGEWEGGHRLLCRFSLAAAPQFNELAKVVQAYLETGLFLADDEADDRICPKCGRRLIAGSSICAFCIDIKKMFGKLLGITRKYMGAFVFAGILLLLSSGVHLVIPYIYRLVVDGQLLSGTGSFPMVVGLIAAMFGCHVLTVGVTIVSSRINNKASTLLANDLRGMAYAKIQALSMTSLSKRTTGDLLSRITTDTNVVQEFLSNQGRWAVQQVIFFFVVLVLLFLSNWRLALLVLVPIPIVLGIVRSTWRFIHKCYEKQWKRRTRVNSVLHDIINGIRVVKTFGNEKREIERFNGASRDFAQICVRNERIWALMFPTLGFLVSIGEFFLLYSGSGMVLGQQMQFGELIQFLAYAGLLYGPLRFISAIPRIFAETATSLAKLFEILDEEPDISDRKGAVDVDIKGEIAFKNVTFGYKPYEPILKNIDLTIRPGEMIGLVGASGVGKSTLINLILRLYDVNEGQLMIDGVDIRDIRQHSLRTRVGVVFQDNLLFAGTIYDNIAYARPNASPEEVLAVSRISRAHEFIIKLPDGYNTIVGEHGYTLSGGERQRVAIARAMLHDPSILILDEATASLDSETEKQIQDALAQLVKGRTTVAIAHRLSTLRNADRIVVLEKGTIAEIGSHNELIRNKGVYFNLVMAQRQTSRMLAEKGQAVGAG